MQDEASRVERLEPHALTDESSCVEGRNLVHRRMKPHAPEPEEWKPRALMRRRSPLRAVLTEVRGVSTMRSSFHRA